MNKIGIISDIHGNYPALKKVIEELEKENVQKIICLGDTVGYYSMINECISLLREKKIISIKGNHDSYLLGEGFCPRSNTVNKCILYQKKIITSDNYSWLKKLKEDLLYNDMYFVHGGLNDKLDEYVDDFDFNKAKELYPNCKYFFTGHSHVQKLLEKDGLVYCNPGSIGQTRDYDKRAAYAILENGKVTLKRVEYDINEIVKK